MPAACRLPSTRAHLLQFRHMRPSRFVVVLLGALALASTARAQEDELVVPPPPAEATAPPPAAPAPLLAGVPLDVVVGPLLGAAEADLAAGRAALALARAAVVASVLPEGVPLRVRAEGMTLLARQRMPQGATAPSQDEIYAPMIAQADLELRAGQPQLALPRLDFVLGRLPAGSPLSARAQQLRAYAATMLGGPPAAPAAAAPGAPLVAPPPVVAPAPPPDDGRRGTGEIVELYITAAAAGAITGAYIPFVASNATAAATTYILTTLAGAGVFAVGVLTLDLTMALPSGVPPTISASIRFGVAHGMLGMGLYLHAPGIDDGDVAFTLAWGGTMAGALVGLGVGFGLTPTVQEERLVESVGIWGAALGTYVAMLTDFRDGTASLALTLGGLDVGLLAGMVMTAIGAVPSTRRTLFLDLGFVAGSAIGALLPSLYFAIEEDTFVWYPIGIGALAGSIGGWLLTFFLTEGLDARAPAQSPVALGVAPLEGGAALTASGSF